MTDKEWRGREHVAAWKASGLSQREYCERNGLSRSALGYWGWKMRHEQSGGFVEVRQSGRPPVQGRADAIELVVGERYRVHLAEGFSVEALRRVLAVLEQR